jgi:hypothetical protein
MRACRIASAIFGLRTRPFDPLFLDEGWKIVGMRPTTEVRFYVDPDTGAPHIYNHHVTEEEVADVLRGPLEVRPGYDGTRVAIGQTRAGRYLRIIYAVDPKPSSVFCITAFDLGPKALWAFRRRQKKKP